MSASKSTIHNEVPTTANVERVAAALRDARDTSRQIVPIVGAGLSADSGFPVVTAIVRYFGKLSRYIKKRVPLAELPDGTRIDELDKRFDGYFLKPWEFVEAFGWPDRFQLNQDLFTKLRKNPETQTNGIVEKAVRDGLDDVLARLNLQGHNNYDKIKSFVEELKQSNSDAPFIEILNKVSDRLKQSWGKSTEFDVVGDWRRLILTFTNYQSDDADALFARFGATRVPGQGHRFLAFLVRSLAVPTVFTFNFDTLIEQAMESAGIKPRVFAMERGAGLPHARMVRDQLSVIKMHGSTHALLLDEQLDRPLTPEYLQRFARIAGQDPLLLVVGCSEGDRRLRDIVTDVLKRVDDERISNGAKENPQPSILWLHYEKQAPEFLKELAKDEANKNKILTCPTNNPGSTLQHLHAWLESCNPAGRVPYLAHVEQPIHLGQVGNETWPTKVGFKLFSSFETKKPIPSASHELLKEANVWIRNGYHLIWIDLEASHTFAGVVGSIIDQCRRYDPDIAPSVLPVDIDRPFDISQGGKEASETDFLTRTIDLAATRVARALQRTRYYLALDGLEAYVWPVTTHHGLTHMAVTNGAKERLENLVEFLVKLSGEELGESVIGVSVDDPQARHNDELTRHVPLGDQVKKLREVSDLASKQSDLTNSEDWTFGPNELNFDLQFSELEIFPLFTYTKSPDALKEITKGDEVQCRVRLGLVLFTLSCFRRIRPLVAVRDLLSPILAAAGEKPNDTVDKLLEQFTLLEGNAFLKQLEGGGFWFTRMLRNRVYEANTKYCDTGHLKKCLTGFDKDEAEVPLPDRVLDCRRAAFQLFLSSMTHQRITRVWYTRTFVQSQDTFACMEYTYHRLSSIRNLAKLRRLMQVASNDQDLAKGVVEGIADCGDLIRHIGSDREWLLEELMFETDGPFDEVLRSTPNTGPIPIVKELEESLEVRHRREVASLHRAWTRADASLRIQIPAEQLLHWCAELLSDDLLHRCNKVVIEYKEVLPDQSPHAVALQPPQEHQKDNSAPAYQPVCHRCRVKGEDTELIDKDLEDGTIKDFRRYLQNLQMKLWIERSDYQVGIGHRWRQLLDDSESATLLQRDYPGDRPLSKEMANRLTSEFTSGNEWSKDFLKKCPVSQHQRILEIVNCSLKSVQESTFSDQELKRQLKSPLALLEKVEAELKRRRDSRKHAMGASNKSHSENSAATENEDLNEAWLGLLHIKAEIQLGHVSMFSHDSFSGNPNDWVPEAAEWKDADKTIREGLKTITTEDVRTTESPRSVILDPTIDINFYLQYRSIFHMLKGRTEWLDESKGRDEAFRKASWYFEMARGGLGERSPLVSALIELYSVEALLAEARFRLFSASSQAEDEAKEAYHLARARYESARGGLQRARESLLASRRNVIWRKFFSRLTTQYHADRLFLGHALLRRSLEEERFSKEKMSKAELERSGRYREELVREFVLRLRRAYQSLLTAVDLYMPHSSDSPQPHGYPNNFRWLYRTWWELTLCGYATGRVVLDDEEIGPEEANTFVTSQLAWLNELSGIQKSQLGEIVVPHQGDGKSKFDELKSEYENELTKEDISNDKARLEYIDTKKQAAPGEIQTWALKQRLTLMRKARRATEREIESPLK